MINIEYKNWYEVDLDDTHHLRKKDTKDWLQKDFTLFVNFKSNWSNIIKEEEENDYCCVVGKPGLHAGIYVAENQIYKFDFWTRESNDSEPKYNTVTLDVPIREDGNHVDVIVGHKLQEKKIYILSYQKHLNEFQYSETTYEDSLIDYTWCPTYVGCAYHDKKTGFPHNSFWSGQISNLKICDSFIDHNDIREKIDLDYGLLYNQFTDGRYFEFDGKKQSVDSIYDISENNNHLRKQRQYKLTYYNSTQYLNDSKTSIL